VHCRKQATVRTVAFPKATCRGSLGSLFGLCITEDLSRLVTFVYHAVCCASLCSPAPRPQLLGNVHHPKCRPMMPIDFSLLIFPSVCRRLGCACWCRYGGWETPGSALPAERTPLLPRYTAEGSLPYGSPTRQQYTSSIAQGAPFYSPQKGLGALSKP
jgi:hypothetical protein